MYNGASESSMLQRNHFMNQAQTEIIQTEIPVALLAQVEDLVNQG